MFILGLTGGIGMGKTLAARQLGCRGWAVTDTDAIARELVEPGQPALEEIRAAFGGGVISSDGGLLRDELARRIFTDPDARRRLEGILHPRIRTVWQGRVAAWQAAGTHAAAVVVIPLLFETDAAAAFTATACVACSEAIQTRRLRERGWSDEEIRRRLAAQLPVREKMARSDYVVWNDGPPEILAAQLDRIPARAQAAVPGGRS